MMSFELFLPQILVWRVWYIYSALLISILGTKKRGKVSRLQRLKGNEINFGVNFFFSLFVE